MLRTRLQRTLNPAATGTALTITHALGTTLDMWWWVPVSDRGLGRTYRPTAQYPNAVSITLVNSVETNVTLDVFCIVFQGRLY